MSEKIRKPIVAANWKMNVMPDEAAQLALNLSESLINEDIELVICPPFTHLDRLLNLNLRGLKIGAQNCHFATQGAYTGEVSAAMLKNMNCDYVLIGHSERRFVDGEESIPLKIERALEAKLSVIYCCGEPLTMRQSNQDWAFVSEQIQFDFNTVEPIYFDQIVIAYEPIWAIGTGLTASKEQAQDMHRNLRNWFQLKYGSSIAQKLRILYGGSVKASNASELSAMSDIDGVLVGGASLNPTEFKAIAKAFF